MHHIPQNSNEDEEKGQKLLKKDKSQFLKIILNIS